MALYTSQIFVDESGTARHTPYVVYGALKFGIDLGLVVNEFEYLRSATGIKDEAKFSNTQNTTFQFHCDMIDIIQASKARFSAVIVDRRNETHPKVEQWRSQAYYTIEAVKLALSDNERTAVIVDNISVPREVNFEGYLQKALNGPYADHDRRVVAITRMASEACWGLQVVDLLTGAVHFAHRLAEGDKNINPDSLRGQLVDHVRGAFNISKLNTATTPRFHVKEMFK